jgi:hypothetical protein
MADTPSNTESKPAVMLVTAEQVQIRGARDQGRKLVEKSVDIEQLQHSFARFLDGLQHIVAVGQRQVGEFTLDEVSVAAEIDANGEFKLLGTGFAVTAGSGVTFTLRRGAAPEASASG